MDREESTRYQSYLLRLWSEGEGSDWRATLEDPHTGERQGFPDIASLVAYLVAQTDVDRPPDQAP